MRESIYPTEWKEYASVDEIPRLVMLSNALRLNGVCLDPLWILEYIRRVGVEYADKKADELFESAFAA